MRHLLDRFAPVRDAEGAGGAPGAAPPAAQSAGGASPPAGGAGSPPAGGEGGAGGVAPPAAPPAAGTPPAAGDAYRPEGLADNLYGTNDRETIDKLAGALKGYRDRDATKGVPDAPEAYRAFEIDKAPEAIRPHLAELAKDPLFDAVAKVALEEKLPVGTLHKLTTALYSQAAEAGVLDYVIDPVKERAALLPEEAKSLPQAQQDAAIEARLEANENFLKLLSQPGADGKAQLDPKVGEHALLMLMDTAAGNQFIEFFRTQMTGGDRAQPLPGAGIGQGSAQNQRAALAARAALPENTAGHPKFSKASWDALQADYKKLVGE